MESSQLEKLRSAGECYSILLRLEKITEIQIGKLGTFKFSAGYYIYTGRAKHGMDARLKRHQAKSKIKHWHIDYLTTHASFEFIDSVIHSEPAHQECHIHQLMLQWPDAKVLIPGFGSSDCRSTCGSHLIYFTTRPNWNDYDFQ
ncbi:DUF123 domain-containing protein [bacterium]